KFSIFTYIQYTTTAAAAILLLRTSNRFLTHAQRGKTIVGAIGCIYLSVANEFGIFPFNFFVKEKFCLCNVHDVVPDDFGIAVEEGRKRLFSVSCDWPYVKLAVQGGGVVFLYGSLARWFYFPPFDALRPREREI
ncbi:hypothetical protein V3C99_016772, partial [Haemonchus contortus]